MTRPSDPASRMNCPLCNKPTDPLHAPFCSRGCKDRDLIQWLDDGYRLPGPPADEEGLDSPADPR